ncbi:PAS domain S-box protein [Thiospirillum jenense]|uniref:histidine kinase n=1 Tax=Thiospirillum jenense TaxID=1653858 RepID=A0A839HK02_9GAMM|nr:PAS domain S-box protein [Thiospirillum jenense]MBB1127027.1 PAS domain S-box protein [Thiospirillum jenense]
MFTLDRASTPLPFLTTTTTSHFPDWTSGQVWLWAHDLDSSLWLAQLLSEIGCALQTIRDPREIDQSAPTPGVLLLDTGAPATAAEELALLTQARSVLPARLPILVIGNQVQVTERLAMIRAGAQRYLTRPINSAHLLHSLAEFLDTDERAHSARILLLGDDAQLQRCADLLTAAGALVHHEPKVQQVFTALEHFAAEVVILPAELPDGSGSELAAVIRGEERYALCSFIFLRTAAASPLPADPTLTDWRTVELLDTPVIKQRLFDLVATRLREVRRNRDTCGALTLALRGLQAQTQALNTHVIISITDGRGRIIHANQNFCTLSGYHCHELLGKTHHLVQSGLHDQPFYQTLWQTITSGQIWRGELCNRNRHGELFWVLSTIVPLIDGNGQPYAYMAMRTDVTPIKRQAEQLRWQARALEAINNGVTISDARLPDMPLVYVNQAFEMITGYRAADVIGQNCRFLQGNEQTQTAINAIRDALKSGSSTQVVLRNYRKDGSAFWNEVSIAPVRDDIGEITHYVGVQKDITERLQAQDALRAERDFIQAALDAVPALFYMIDQQLHLIEFNTRLLDLTGWNTEAVKQLLAPDLFVPEQRAEITRAFTAAFNDGIPIAQEFQLLTTAGERIPLYLRADRRRINDTEVLIGTGQDMSAYHQVVASLRLSEERLSRSQAFANIGLWDWNIQSNTLFYSEQLTTLLGGEILPANSGLAPLFALIHPKDRDQLRDAIEYCLRGCELCDEEFRVIQPDGGLRWLLLRGNIIADQQHQPLRMLGVIQDISRLKQAEMVEKRARREIKAVIDSLCALICVIDAQGVILSINRSWRQRGRCLTNNHNLLLTGNNYLNLHIAFAEQGRADSARLVQGIRDVLSGNLPGFETEIHGPVECEEIVYLVRVTPLQGASENDPRVVVSHQDVTETRRIETDLRHAKEAAERASQAKSEFLSSMSHELRTPMNAVLGFAQLLEYDAHLNAEQHESVQEILRAGRHLLELINGVLDLARIEAGKIDLTIEPVALLAVAEECQSLLTPLAEPRGIRLSIQAHTLLGLVVYADRIRLKQIIINLLSNAIKYNHVNGQVIITAERRAAMIRLTITDTGAGIAAEHLETLFQPFTRLVTEDAAIEGTGIGLTVCQRLTEAMQGQIGVDSTVGQGSQFWIELPGVEPDLMLSAEAISADLTATDEWTTCAGCPRYTVLQIEDNPANLKLMERLFARRGDIFALSAPSAALGLELARTQRPDLILMDINMPGMDGYAALTALRLDPVTRAIPVVALTANATLSDVERGIAAGFDAYLTKPLDIRLLVETLNRLLEG